MHFILEGAIIGLLVTMHGVDELGGIGRTLEIVVLFKFAEELINFAVINNSIFFAVIESVELEVAIVGGENETVWAQVAIGLFGANFFAVIVELRPNEVAEEIVAFVDTVDTAFDFVLNDNDGVLVGDEEIDIKLFALDNRRGSKVDTEDFFSETTTELVVLAEKVGKHVRKSKLVIFAANDF